MSELHTIWLMMGGHICFYISGAPLGQWGDGLHIVLDKYGNPDRGTRIEAYNWAPTGGDTVGFFYVEDWE